MTAMGTFPPIERTKPVSASENAAWDSPLFHIADAGVGSVIGAHRALVWPAVQLNPG